ncbi:MAG: ABC transporter permease [Elusimicrobia bacterium]|nr:ABC transporter permease [Elusimicrobiota bacterium]
MALIISGGFIEDAITQLREAYIRAILGHVQIHRKGYYQKGGSKPFQYMIPSSQAVLQELARFPQVKNLAPRLEFSGLLSTGETSIAVIGQGVDPERERHISTLFVMTEGSNLEVDDEFMVIVGTGLASAVGLKAGSPAVLLANTKAGAINGLDAQVKGVFHTVHKAYDDRAVRVPLKMAQKLLETQNVQTITIIAHDTSQTDELRSALELHFKGRGLDLEAVAWHQMPDADYLLKTIAYNRRLFLILNIIIIISVVLSIINTMNMAVIERIGEIGTFMAIGYRPREVARLFLVEGAVMGLLGGVLGMAGGYVSARLISWIGIPMPTPPGTTVEWIARIEIVPEVFGLALAAAIATALAASVMPAMKITRLEIGEALRRNV